MNKTAFGPFTQLLPFTGLAIKGALNDDQLQIIENAGILVAEGKILNVGPFEEIKKDADEIREFQTDSVCLPGFIDAHTHICFAGSRANDYAMRNAGKSYLEIAKAGGGIWDTVSNTRQASEQHLIEGIKKRSQQHLMHGVTTIEIKSGYGLSFDEELKMLHAIKKAAGAINQDIVATCLAAHMKPKDWQGSPSSYLRHISDDLFPILKAEQLSHRIDAFIEESAFTIEEITPYFKKAHQFGFDLTVHADQFSTGGSQVAVSFGALSADHLEASGDREISLLAKSNTIAMALPGASLGLGCAFTPARKLLDQGAALAIASDHNPGSAPMGNLLTQACILGTFEKLSNAEVLAAITFRAAKALKLNDRGTLAPGQKADFLAFPTNDYRDITYHQGQLRPMMVFKDGKQIYG